jgi:hypothetical protein
MITLNLEKITTTLRGITLSGETDATEATKSITQAGSIVSPVSPLPHHAALTGETHVSTSRVSPVSHQKSDGAETRQTVDSLGVQGPVAPVAPVSSDVRVAQTSPAPFWARARRPAPCVHRWTQKGQRATCEVCGFTAPVLPKEDVSRGGPAL